MYEEGNELIIKKENLFSTSVKFVQVNNEDHSECYFFDFGNWASFTEIIFVFGEKFHKLIFLPLIVFELRTL